MNMVETTRQDICHRLTSFVEDYQQWSLDQRSRPSKIETVHQEAAESIMKKIEFTVERLQKGISFLRQSDEAIKRCNC